MSQKAILLIGSDASSERPQAFECVLVGDELRRVGNVSEALNYLQRAQVNRENISLPGLVLVWSTVGRTSISKLISWMRSEEALAQIPIVVLTAVAEIGMQRNCEIASNSYLVPVADTETLLDVVSKHMPDRSTCTRPITRAFSA